MPGARDNPEPSPIAAPSLLLVGNPNVGKSVLFGLLTGHYATVSNYPGTTVEVCRAPHTGSPEEVVDLPGTNSLLAASEDERVTRDVLLSHLGDSNARVLQVCDTKNLRRALALTLQLAELDLPMALVANMQDEAARRGVTVDLELLAGRLGVAVLGSVAIRGQGLEPLVRGGLRYALPRPQVDYGDVIEPGIARLGRLLPASCPGRRGLALMLLAGEHGLGRALPPLTVAQAARIEEVCADVRRRLPEALRFSIQRARLATADALIRGVSTQDGRPERSLLQGLGDLSIHPLWGLPVVGLVLYFLYLFVGVLGAGKAVDFFEHTLFVGYLTPGVAASLRWLLPAEVAEFLVGSPGVALGSGPGLLVGDYGLFSMALSYAFAIVLPIVGSFFLAFSVMEDSGYLPRLAVVLNRFFRAMGLNGKAVLPMVLGLGCDTMATMTTRILPTRKERLLVTLLLALAVPCSAQLGVILGMLAGLSAWATASWLALVFGVMLLVGYLGSKVLPGRAADFILEIPPMRRPVLSNILVKTVARIEWYLKEAVPLFVVGTLVLWVSDRLQLLGGLRRLAAPVVVGLLGLPEQATDAFLIGFLRRDYGAAGLYALFGEALKSGAPSVETQIQVIVAMVTITLFVPCIANVLMMVREHGLKAAAAMTAFIFPFAFGVGALANTLLRAIFL